MKKVISGWKFHYVHSRFLLSHRHHLSSTSDVATASSKLRFWWSNAGKMKKFGLAAAAGSLVFGGATAGFLATANSELKSVKPIETKVAYDRTSVAVLPEVKIARSIISPIDTSGLGLRLYQYQSCPFCCKTRAFFDYYGFSYDVVEVNSVTRKQTRFSEYKKVPILIATGYHNKQMNDSSYIISLFRSFVLDPSKALDEIATFYPIYKITDEKGKSRYEVENKYFIMFQEQLKDDKKAIENRKEERTWRIWVDDNLVHTISPNIYRTFGESLDSFRWFSKFGNWEENFPTWERVFVVYVGAAAMYFIGKRLKKKHSLKPDVRQSLYDSCNEWLRGKGSQRTFMGGDKPNLADLAVYGALTSFEGTMAFADLLQHTAIGPWFYATKEAVRCHLGAEEFSRRLKSVQNS